MEFIRIKSSENRYVAELFELYSVAFPENQRHSEIEFKALLDNEVLFHCNAVLMNSELVGFFNYWDFEKFIFVEHIAIEPPLRGHKLGEKIITMARKSVSVPIVLEVEKAEQSEWSARRIEFYHRIGFHLVPADYVQPPYRAGDEYIPLHLMSDDLDFAEQNFVEIKNIIHQKVYRVKE